eukprot:3350559-Amphidinium_carterae.1
MTTTKIPSPRSKKNSQVIQTKWYIRQGAGNNTNKKLKATFVAKGYTQHINPDKLYVAICSSHSMDYEMHHSSFNSISLQYYSNWA